MGAKAEQKGRSRERIIASAGGLIRENGIAGTSVADVMGGAGMTVGGFYAHFPSKRELMAETLRTTLRDSMALLATVAGDRRGADWIAAVARAYLSRTHRDNPASGCPLPATAGEIGSAGRDLREVLAEEISAMAGRLEGHLEEDGARHPRGEALAGIATMIGGLTLARATKGTPVSDEVLEACRDHIERSLGG